MNKKYVHDFEFGLLAKNCHHYLRQITYVDYIAYLLGNNELDKPEASRPIARQSKFEEVKWHTIEARKDKKFHDNALGKGCIYLVYNSDYEENAILNVSGHRMLYLNGEPHNGDMYSYGWVYLPVKLKKGLNEIFVLGSASSVSAKLLFKSRHAILSVEDTTFPHAILGDSGQILIGGIVLINLTNHLQTRLILKSRIQGKERTVQVPSIPPLTSRKVQVQFDITGIRRRGTQHLELQLLENGTIVDQSAGEILALEQDECYNNTFISDIDNSVQYYSVVPPQPTSEFKRPALFLSLHGKDVSSLNLAKAHSPKDWGVIVAPTNRRPRGFSWEDWGRLDAMEVLSIVKEKFQIDDSRIYLTGHSMGGRGTWYLGATYPGTWAAIAPCAAYAAKSLSALDRKHDSNNDLEIENFLTRVSNASNIIELINNYKAFGICIQHGDNDEIIPVEYSREMKLLLGSFHNDLVYQEYEGGTHWYGNECVDSEHIFDYFKSRKVPTSRELNNIDFSTANPGISSTMHWVSILQQEQSLKHSRIQADRNIEKRCIEIYTKNVSVFQLCLKDFETDVSIKFSIDGNLRMFHKKLLGEKIHFYKNNEAWKVGPSLDPSLKGPHRNGTFKEAFKNNMVFIYGTSGSEEENKANYCKARYDSETWYYRANGAVEILTDKQFNLELHAHRGVILYGNSDNNCAWNYLLEGCPIRVKRGSLTIGDKLYSGDDYGAYFVWPRPNSHTALTAVISGTGVQGMRAAESCQYFDHHAQFPDFMIFTLKVLIDGIKGIKLAGFFGNDWSLQSGEIVFNDLLN